MEKGVKTKIIRALLACFGLTNVIVGVFMVVMNREGILDFICAKKESYDVTSVGFDDMKPGDHVTMDVKVTTGYFMSRYTITSKNGRKTGQKETRYYMVPVFKNNQPSENWKHSVVVAKTGNFKKIEEATSHFTNWLKYMEDPDPNSVQNKIREIEGNTTLPEEIIYTVDGRVAKMTDEEIKYLKKAVGNDYLRYVKPYVIKPLWAGGKQEDTSMLLIMGAGVTVLGIVMLLPALFIGHKKRKAAKAAARTMQQ